MKKPILKVVKSFIPPLLFSIAKVAFQKNGSKPTNWVLISDDLDTNQQAGQGFEDSEILKRCASAILKVKNKEAAYERDGVIFDKIEYSYGLLAGLQKAALDNNGNLSVLDFGGSLGSTYFQNKEFLNLQKLEWSIVEQGNFVKTGLEQFEDDILKFYYTIDECLAERMPNVLVLSGVLQYLDNPYAWIEKFIQLDIQYIILDRTAFARNDDERIAIQNVSNKIHKSSFKHHFFNEQKLLNFIKEYTVLADFKSYADGDSVLPDGTRIFWKGFIFQRTKNNYELQDL